MRTETKNAGPGEEIFRPKTVAENYLAVLKDRGVDVLYIGAGTDTAPIVEAYARAEESGLAFPKPVLAVHENLAVGMAHGYYMVSGRPQAVMLHVSVGTANAVCALMNAARARTYIFHIRADALVRIRLSRESHERDPLGPGDVRPSGHGARIYEMGIRAARRNQCGTGGGPRAQYRDGRTEGAGVSHTAARGARSSSREHGRWPSASDPDGSIS